MPALSFEELNELFSYDAETGLLTWKVRGGPLAPKGAVAGYRAKNRYIKVGYRKQQDLAHRIAWTLHYGAAPAGFLDHRNGDPSDNRICNLREASFGLNSFNRRLAKNNKSGAPGVIFHQGKWMASIGKRHIGYFKEFDDAVSARKSAELEMFGEYARGHYGDHLSQECAA